MTIPIRVYNTQSRAVESLETIEPGKVRMYVCGVTPYADAHVGHAMSSIVFDVIKRFLVFSGYEVRHVVNFTDIDDKIIARANREGISPDALTEELIAKWHEETKALNVLPATVYPRATQEVPEITRTIEGLIASDHAYEVEGDVYFRVRSFAGYGKLSHRSLDDLLAGARIDVDERKEDPLDFALWKAAKPGEPRWPSPWGNGRPGWHIECSAMCAHHLDGAVDIHGGGADLIFPHHENEIAQSEAFLGREPFARYWVHNGLLQLGGEKMSKSIGNLVPVSELIERRRVNAFRLLVLQSHYRAPLTYTDEGLEAAHRGISRLLSALEPSGASDAAAPEDDALAEEARRTKDDVVSALADDFDTPRALASLFELARSINRVGGTGVGVTEARTTLAELLGILGFNLNEPDPQANASAEPFIELLVSLRADLRIAKQWQLADRVRDGLEALGVSIADGPSGTTWRRS